MGRYVCEVGGGGGGGGAGAIGGRVGACSAHSLSLSSAIGSQVNHSSSIMQTAHMLNST